MSVDLLGEAFLIQPCGGERAEWKDKMEGSTKNRGRANAEGKDEEPTSTKERVQCSRHSLQEAQHPSAPTWNHLILSCLSALNPFCAWSPGTHKLMCLDASEILGNLGSPRKLFICRVQHLVCVTFFTFEYNFSILTILLKF